MAYSMSAGDVSSSANLSLIILFENSMSPQQETRVLAEKNLALCSTQPGFLPTLLTTLKDLPAGPLQKAAAIYLKNEIEKRWTFEGQPNDNISLEDRLFVKNSIVASLVAAHTSSLAIVPLLKAIVHRLVRNDFPKQWDGLLEQIAPLLQQNNQAMLEAGLLILHEIIEWKGYDDEQISSRIFSDFIPQLLAIGLSALASASQSEQAAGLLKAVLKTVYSTISYKWNPVVLGENTAVSWCSLITQTIQLSIPHNLLVGDAEELAEKPLWKAKKWAFHCQNRIFERHGCPDGSSFQVPKQQTSWSFSKFYMANLALPILQVNLDLINEVIRGQFITDRVFCLLTNYIGEVIRSKRLLELVLPNLPGILSSFAFPRLCFSDADKELWESDALEYCRSMLDPFDDYYSPQVHAANLFIDLCKARKKHVFPIILQLISQVLNDSSVADQSVRRKDGALLLVGSLAKILLKSDMGAQVEGMFSHHLLPIFSSLSSPPYLKVRACWTIEQFADMQFQDQETVLNILRAILAGLQDAANLPVQVQSACTLGALIDQSAVQEALPSILAPVVEAVLSLNNVVEADSLAHVLEKLVSMFSEELAPYAVQLCTSVRDTAMRVVRESGSIDPSTGSVEFEDSDRMMAIVGMMRTITTLVDSMADSPQLLAGLEDIVCPLLLFILEHRVNDVYEEVFELLESFTYLRKTASPAIWNIGDILLKRLFKESNRDYVEEIAGIIDNCVTYEPGTFCQNISLQQTILEMATKTLECDEDEYNYAQEALTICMMLQAILMNCGRSIDSIHHSIVSLAMKRVAEEKCDTDSDTIIHLEVVLSGLLANPELTLKTLEQHGWTEMFLAKLSLLSSKFVRVYDKRLLIASITSLISHIRIESMPAIMQSHFSTVMSVFAEAIETLSNALAERKRLQEEAENESDSEDGFDFDSDDYEDLDSKEDEVEHPEESKQVGFEGTVKTASEEDEFDDGEWEEDALEEDIYFETSLDKVDMASIVQNAVIGFARSQPNAFTASLQNLSATHKNLFQSIVEQRQ